MPDKNNNFEWEHSDNFRKLIERYKERIANGSYEKDIEQDHDTGKMTQWLSPMHPLYYTDDDYENDEKEIHWDAYDMGEEDDEHDRYVLDRKLRKEERKRFRK